MKTKSAPPKKVPAATLTAPKPRSKQAFHGVKGERASFVLPSDVSTDDLSGAQPHPSFKYHGGPVVQNPRVFSVFAGDWAGAGSQARMARLNQFLKDLVVSKYMNILSQYGCGKKGKFIGTATVSNVDHDLSEKDIHKLLQAGINDGSIPEPAKHNNVYIVFLDDLTGVKDKGLGVVMCEAKSDNAFGYHHVFTTKAGNPCNYAIIPGLSDACLGETCGGSPGCSLHTTQSQEERQTQVTSHEFSEMISNPTGDGWWDNSSGDENGDLCNGIPGTITVAGRTWTVQRMYSKKDDLASQGANICILPPAKAIPPLVANVKKL